MERFSVGAQLKNLKNVRLYQRLVGDDREEGEVEEGGQL